MELVVTQDCILQLLEKSRSYMILLVVITHQHQQKEGVEEFLKDQKLIWNAIFNIIRTMIAL